MKTCLPAFAARFQCYAPPVGKDFDCHIQPPLGQMVSGPIRPLDESNAVLSLVPAEFDQLFWRFQAIKIEMPDRERPGIVQLYERISRAWDIHSPAIVRYQPPGERGFSGTKIPMKGDHVPFLKQSGYTCPYVTQGSLVWTFKNHCHLMHITTLR